MYLKIRIVNPAKHIFIISICWILLGFDQYYLNSILVILGTSCCRLILNLNRSPVKNEYDVVMCKYTNCKIIMSGQVIGPLCTEAE